MPKPPQAAAAACLTLTAIGCASTPEPVTVYEHDRFRFSAQPTKANLKQAAADGVTTVISLRSQEEMDQLDFDQAEFIDSLGMRYTHIPMGRTHGYNPEQVAAFNRALTQAEGPVYLHCASGGRARQVWMVYAISTGELTIDEAKQIEQTIGAKPPILEQLLDQPITYDLAPKPEEGDDTTP